MNWKRGRHGSPGFTLVEVMVVVTIVLVLATLVYFAMGPAMRAKAWETRIRSDLRQTTLAINLYRQEYDDKLPLRIEDLPKGTPTRIEGWPKVSRYSLGFPDSGYYAYTMPYPMQVFQERFAKYRWDPANDPIILATCFRRDTGSKKWVVFELVEGQDSRHKMNLVLVIGAFLDGSVRWTDIEPQWNIEFACRRHLLGGIK